MDYFGQKNSTVNYGLTYTAKAWGGLIGGYVVAWLVITYKSFTMPIFMSVIFGFAAMMLVFPKVLKKPNVM